MFLLVAVSQSQQILFLQGIAIAVDHFCLFGGQNGFARKNLQRVSRGGPYLQNAALVQRDYDRTGVFWPSRWHATSDWAQCRCTKQVDTSQEDYAPVTAVWQIPDPD